MGLQLKIIGKKKQKHLKGNIAEDVVPKSLVMFSFLHLNYKTKSQQKCTVKSY